MGASCEQEEARPWEQAGAVRRDCEPDRASLLRILIWVGFCFALVSPCVPVSIPPALALGVLTWALAHRDLARMRAGLVDPAGRERTERACNDARGVIVAAAVSGFVWGVVCLGLALSTWVVPPAP